MLNKNENEEVNSERNLSFFNECFVYFLHDINNNHNKILPKNFRLLAEFINIKRHSDSDSDV